MNTALDPALNARNLFLPYVLTLAAAMTAIQVVVAARGRVDLVTAILTGIVAIGMVVWLAAKHRSVARVRFGFAIAHATAFAIITTSFNLHALIHLSLLARGGGSLNDAAALLFQTPWFGATLVMTSLWGFGLTVHLLGSILGRGWDRA